MHSFEIIPHTADAKIKATGSTRAGLLVAALKGMFAIAEPQGLDEARDIDRKFTLEADSFQTLLIDLLNEAISLSDANHEVYEGIKFTLITDKQAEGSFTGHPISSFTTQIKAATYHDLEVKKNEEGKWEATITFDV